MKKETIQIIALILIQIIILMPISFADSINITDVNVADVTDSSATVTWKTNVSSRSRLDYGKTKPPSEFVSDTNYVTDHSVLIPGLDNATEYFFSVYSDSGADSETDNNGGNYYSLETDQDVKPSINVAVPRYHNQNSISLSITTDPDSEVDVWVN
ncbi:MAG: fibronectin type III domain-containing protein, partial [Nanoarchaeota archaeon]